MIAYLWRRRAYLGLYYMGILALGSLSYGFSPLLCLALLTCWLNVSLIFRPQFRLVLLGTFVMLINEIIYMEPWLILTPFLIFFSMLTFLQRKEILGKPFVLLWLGYVVTMVVTSLGLCIVHGFSTLVLAIVGWTTLWGWSLYPLLLRAYAWVTFRLATPKDILRAS